MALVTLQTIFQDAFPAYAQTHHSPPTSESGPRHHAVSDRCVRWPYPEACPDGHMTRVWYQFVSASLLPPMHVPPDRALARAPASAAARL